MADVFHSRLWRPARYNACKLNRPRHNSKITRLASSLLYWFSLNARDLPWRRTRDPYAIWVSEIMLQQTQVKTVIPYWERWMRELPTIPSLAKASAEKIHKLWEGLGYYTRVRNLQKAAREIVARHHGEFPRDYDNILALPGIGRYTAGAISSIAFDEPQPILDGNIIRVLTRVFGIVENPREKSTNQKLWQLAQHLVTASLRNAGSRRRKEADTSCNNSLSNNVTTPLPASALNQSLMELGALICTPRQPACLLCPVRPDCIAFRTRRVEQLPNLDPRAAATARRFAAFVIQNRGRFLVRQRPARVVNAHLWEFPNLETSAVGPKLKESAARELALKISTLEKLCTIKHTITRYRITLEVFRATTQSYLSKKQSSDYFSPSPGGEGRGEGERPLKMMTHWLTLPQLDTLAFTSAHRKILNHLALANLKPKTRNQKLETRN
jgi:A/G-specific adenine glycosylase